MSRILIAEDDRGIADFIDRGLTAAGYTCDIAENGVDAFNLARTGAFDLMVLDLGLPEIDGVEVLRQLRAVQEILPVIVLTARTNIEDRVRTLEGGANDYMPKPFQFAELLARIRLRLMDRSEGDSSHILTRDDLTLDLRTQRVKVGDKWRDVSRREIGLLETLMRNPGEVMSRAQLLSKVWGMDFDPGSNVVDVYIRTLRKKIGSERVETVRGAGYRLR